MSQYGYQTQCTQDAVIPGESTATDMSLRRLEFNNEIVNALPGFSKSDGQFALSSPANYSISWFITTKTGLGEYGVTFALIAYYYNAQGAQTKEMQFPSTNSMKIGSLSGSAILNVAQGETCKIGLYNMGTDEVTLATNVLVKANLTIHPYLIGSYSSSYGLVGLTLTMDSASTAGNTLAYNAPLKFNKQVNTSSEIFAYTLDATSFTILTAGNYLFNWSVNLDGSQDADVISFSLQSNGVDLLTFDSTLVLQQTHSGFGFLQVSSDQTFSLVNISKKMKTGTSFEGADLTLAKSGMKAILRVVGHS